MWRIRSRTCGAWKSRGDEAGFGFRASGFAETSGRCELVEKTSRRDAELSETTQSRKKRAASDIATRGQAAPPAAVAAPPWAVAADSEMG